MPPAADPTPLPPLSTSQIELEQHWNGAKLGGCRTGNNFFENHLIAWIKQWHNDPDPSHGQRMGDYLDSFVDEEAKALGLTRAALAAWQLPVTRTVRKNAVICRGEFIRQESEGSLANEFAPTK